jgi:hypothetical protein
LNDGSDSEEGPSSKCQRMSTQESTNNVEDGEVVLSLLRSEKALYFQATQSPTLQALQV